jgi:hypothetical protein
MSNDDLDFVDPDSQPARKTAFTPPSSSYETGSPAGNRPPTREEIESLVSQKQQKLAELRRAQEELERERAALEDLRQRQLKFQNGRKEMLENLTRGIGLIEEAELAARRDADQMARALAQFREAVSKVQAINENRWSQENLTVELTQALTVIENARIEWNAAQVKFPVLNTETGESGPFTKAASSPNIATMSAMALCKVGLALTWPVLLAGLLIFAALVMRH